MIKIHFAKPSDRKHFIELAIEPDKVAWNKDSSFRKEPVGIDTERCNSVNW